MNIFASILLVFGLLSSQVASHRSPLRFGRDPPVFAKLKAADLEQLYKKKKNFARKLEGELLEEFKKHHHAAPMVEYTIGKIQKNGTYSAALRHPFRFIYTQIFLAWWVWTLVGRVCVKVVLDWDDLVWKVPGVIFFTLLAMHAIHISCLSTVLTLGPHSWELETKAIFMGQWGVVSREQGDMNNIMCVVRREIIGLFRMHPHVKPIVMMQHGIEGFRTHQLKMEVDHYIQAT